MTRIVVDTKFNCYSISCSSIYGGCIDEVRKLSYLLVILKSSKKTSALLASALSETQCFVFICHFAHHLADDILIYHSKWGKKGEKAVKLFYPQSVCSYKQANPSLAPSLSYCR